MHLNTLRGWIRHAISHPETPVWERLQRRFDECAVLTCGTMGSITQGNANKVRGDLFEILTAELLRAGAFASVHASEVIPFGELSQEQRTYFRLGTRDMGIDLVVRTTEGEWFAVQCKYRRKPTGRSPNGYPIKHAVSWAELSTFYALADRTGPPGGWAKLVVITNAKSVNRQGRKTAKDLSICGGSLGSIAIPVWHTLAGDPGRTVGETASKEPAEPPLATLRQLRTRFFEEHRG